jgi:hypothetical protein
VFTLGLALQTIIRDLIFASAHLAHCQGVIEDMQELSCAGGKKSAVIRAARRRAM